MNRSGPGKIESYSQNAVRKVELNEFLELGSSLHWKLLELQTNSSYKIIQLYVVSRCPTEPACTYRIVQEPIELVKISLGLYECPQNSAELERSLKTQSRSQVSAQTPQMHFVNLCHTLLQDSRTNVVHPGVPSSSQHTIFFVTSCNVIFYTFVKHVWHPK